MKRINLLTMQAFASVLIFFLSACAEEPLGSNDQTGKGHTITLRLSATVVPIPETKATATPVRSGSNAEAAGFYYEMVSSDAVTPGFSVEMESTTPEGVVISLGTKAPATLKNVYAFLFTSDGAFNGRADIGAFTAGSATYITFVEVKTTTAKGCRLVMVANDANAATSYSSSTAFGTFSGSYPEFQKLTITNEIKEDKDVPYAGSVIIAESLSESGVTAEVPLSWTLAKITLKNPMFNITGGPARSSITLYNAGVRRFATQGNDNYDGTGSTQTIDAVPSIDGSNADSVTWYVGENIQPAVTSINSAADRNNSKAPTKACYIRIASAAQSVSKNINPKIGEEYTQGGAKSFTYDYYLGNSSILTDFALRRHTDYTINTEIGGTLAVQEQLAAEDGRVTLTKPESGGLAIGKFGGATGHTPVIERAPAVTGSFEKMLLLEPNTTRSTTDNVEKTWAVNKTTIYQPEGRRFWDRSYIYGITTDGTVGGMNKAAGGIYDYCYQLTLGNVEKGTWYVPTHAQLQAIWAIYGSIKENNKETNYWWSSTENSISYAWGLSFMDGATYANDKMRLHKIRCVRDFPDSETSSYVTVINGYPVIDLSELAALGCLLTKEEAATRLTEINGQTASNETIGIGGDANGVWNVRMSSLFQVMRTNLEPAPIDWASAYEACKQYHAEGGDAGQWRLPTQRELMMIWALHPQLQKKGGCIAFNAARYSSCIEVSPTETHPADAWYIGFSIGDTTFDTKTTQHAVRCVRDLL